MAEKRTIELEIQDNSKSLKAQYKEAVQELQRVSAQYGETSAQAVKAARAAAELKDQIGFSKDLVDSFNPDAKFNSLTRSIGGVLDGFQAFEGALGLVGVEGEAVQETMLKVQSAMAVSQGLQGLMEARDSFKQLGTVAMNALKGIRTGLAATGIGLFLVALGTVVAYWDDIKEAVSGVSDEQANLNKLSHENFETSKKELDTLDAQDNTLKLQGKSEKEILNLKIKKIDATIQLGIIELENVKKTSKAEEEAAIKNYNTTKAIVDFILDAGLFLPKLMLKPIDLAIQGANKVSEALGLGKLVSFDLNKAIEGLEDKASSFVAGSLFNVEDLKKENKETQDELQKQIDGLINQRAGLQLSLKEIDKANSQKSIDAQKDEQDKKLQAEKEYNEKLRAYYDAIEQERQGQINDAKEKELQALDNKFEELYKKADEANQSDKELLIQHQQEIADINTKFDLLAQEEAKKTADELAKIEKEKLDEIEKANKEAAEKDAALKKRNKEFGIEMALSGLSTISSLTELFGKKSEKQAKRAFQVQKAAQVASALINTYQSATGAYASQFLPVPDPTSPVRGGIAAGLAVAAGLVNVAKIASQKFEGGSTGGGGGAPAGGGGGGAQMQAPQFNTIGSSGINQLATLQQQPVQAYVVSGEVTSAQALDRNRVQNATL
jgi:hypothetical protein